ncbi:MAG: hypothetical protein CSB55_07325 [Candidatus Cloacimonadota bacterium]|nr:MAG: hypothetical protein CSB55_07325 [Candidatus Cloacimonadota bacterium]
MTDKINHKERLRKAYEMSGLEGFHDYEVLELVLSYCIIRKDTKKIAKALLKKFGSFSEIVAAPLEMITQTEGVGIRTAVYLKLLKDANTYFMREELIGSVNLSSSEAVFKFLYNYYKCMKHEEFKVIYLNSQNIVIYEKTMFKGTLNEAHVYVREIVEKALLLKAVAVILVHNHPSGNINPSNQDIIVTNKIKKALNLIDVRTLDHLIIGDNSYCSFADKGII